MIASGFCTSEPGPVARIIGIRLKIVIDAVIRIGRSLYLQAVNTASSVSIPDARNCRMQETSTTPFSTATPKSTIKPTEAGTDKYVPVRCSANMPPTNANGKVIRPALQARAN